MQNVLNCIWDTTCANIRSALHCFLPPCVAHGKRLYSPCRCFSFTLPVLSAGLDKKLLALHFLSFFFFLSLSLWVRWMCCYSLCSGGSVASAISMRVVDKAFQLCQQWAALELLLRACSKHWVVTRTQCEMCNSPWNTMCLVVGVLFCWVI